MAIFFPPRLSFSSETARVRSVGKLGAWAVDESDYYDIRISQTCFSTIFCTGCTIKSFRSSSRNHQSCASYFVMIIAQTLLLLAVVSSSIWKLGGTSGIFGRGDGESLPYPDLGGAFRALFDWDVFNFLPGASEPVPPRTDQNAGTVAEPEFKLNAETSQPPGTHGDCNQVSALSSLIVTSVR